MSSALREDLATVLTAHLPGADPVLVEDAVTAAERALAGYRRADHPASTTEADRAIMAVREAVRLRSFDAPRLYEPVVYARIILQALGDAFAPRLLDPAASRKGTDIHG